MTENQAEIDQETEELNTTLQHRADYIPIEDLKDETAVNGTLFKKVNQLLTNRSLITIVGPRGCGKTHMMRYAWLSCRDTDTKPFAVFASFQRYFRLEPLLSSNAGATQLFHSWVLARVLLSLKESCDEWNPKIPAVTSILESEGYPYVRLVALAAKLERSQLVDGEWAEFSDSLSIDKVKSIIDRVCTEAGRKFSVILLDDAAMTLTPDYLVEFLDVVRSLKSASIAPKVSVYPGSTEMSPRFHQGQDAVSKVVWVSVQDSDYDAIIHDIAVVRVKNLNEIPDDVQSILRFAAFGIPRAYLTMLEDFQREKFTTAQQGVNRIIGAHLQARLSEFKSLGKKIPKFETLITAGEDLLQATAKALKEYNRLQLARQTRGITYGLRADERTPLLERTLQLLIEAGLIFYDDWVKHGSPERIYHKYIPHSCLLLSIGAFTGVESSGSIRATLEAIRYRQAKHPLRRSLASIVGQDFISSLNFALPRCAHCNTPRLSDTQRFCHSCGNQLVDASTFNLCLDTLISDVPGLTGWQREKIQGHLPHIRTVRDYLAKQDPAADLLSVSGFGKRRTTKIVDVLNSFVDDYLS